MKEKILIAIDSSDSSGKILDYGINLAEKLDAEVTVVHAIEPYSKRSTIMNQLNAAMVKQTNELYELAGKELMDAAKKQTAGAKVPVHYETLIGNAAQQILTAAKKSGYWQPRPERCRRIYPRQCQLQSCHVCRSSCADR